MIKKQKWVFYLSVVVILPLILVLPLIVNGDNDYNISDIALTPGPHAYQLNFTWHTTITIDEDTNIEDIDIAGDPCEMKIAKRLFDFWGAKKLFPFFPPGSRTFEGTWASAGTDENGNADYYCKVTVDGLERSVDYAYKLADGDDNWSDSFDYTARDQKKFGFFFVADSQIGASGPIDLLRSQEGKLYIEEYYETNALPSDETIRVYLEFKNPEATTEEIDDLLEEFLEDVVGNIYDPVFYNEYSEEGMDTDFSDVALLDEGLAEGLLALIAERRAEQMEASADDTEGWATTVELITDMFPKTSFMISGGDQVELMDKEWEYTGFFTPYELTSIPVAPTYASHDRALNFEYHFNLPNESEEYGQDSNGVGDYYFTHGNTLFMVLNMDVTNGLFPGGPPPGPPPGGGPGGPPPADTDGDGVNDDDDLCPDTPEGTFVDEDGCPLDPKEDYDGDGVLNENDLCSNTLTEHFEAGLISEITGCPYEDVDSDGIPDYDADDNLIDRCNNTYNDLTVDEDGCADCAYIETDDELRAWLEELENGGDLDEFKASLEEHRLFIEESIAANPQAKWKIVVWHYSIYSAAMHSTDDQSEGIRYLFTPMLEELDIDVVLMGHDHAYTKTYQMMGNEPQIEQTVGPEGQVINPTGILYLTMSSSSGSKYYDLNCNIGDETSDSAVYYEYADVYYEKIPTFTYFEVDENSLKFKSFSYTLDDNTGYYETILIDEYVMEKK